MATALATVTHPHIETQNFHGLITAAPQMQRFFELLERVAKTDSSILIRGESGTGKELAARAIHKISNRQNKPFRALNCATFTPELLASQLFGHVRGAFTGATRDHVGLLAAANGGTVFLDEIAEMPLGIQAQLLRVLQERTFIPVGSITPITVDLRFLSATNKALRNEVEERRFREDLMYRVRVVPLFLPDLVDRDGDVEALFWHFVDLFNETNPRVITRITREALDAVLAYRWPGNVRELRNAVEMAFAIGVGDTITLEDLPPELRGEAPVSRHISSSERQRVFEALRRTNGNKGEAANLLGISRSTLWRKLREYHHE
jgi:two-component system response regulator AtoC